MLSKNYPAASRRLNAVARLTVALSATTILGLAHPALAQAATEPPYDTMFDVGMDNTTAYAHGDGLSDDGSVVTFTSTNADGLPNAYRWTANGTQSLGTLGGLFSYTRSVSGDGKVIVGASSDASGNFSGFRWTAEGGMQSIGNLGSFAEALATSQDGSAIVGYSYLDPFSDEFHAFRWTAAGGIQDIDTWGSRYSFAYDISADGKVVTGNAEDPATLGNRAFRWTEGTGMQNLGTLGGTNSVGTRISRDGTTIIGYSEVSMTDPGIVHGFRWTQARGMESFGFSTDYRSVSAWDVSDDGKVVVGSFAQSPQSASTAYRWVEGTGVQILGSLGGNASVAYYVSGDGTVVAGDSRTAQGTWHAYRWTEWDGMKDLGTLGGQSSSVWGISRDGTTIIGDSQTQTGAWRAFIYRTKLIDFTNMIGSFGLTASDIEAAGEGQRQNLSWVLDSTCSVTLGGKACVGGALQFSRVAADDKAPLMRRHDQAVKANVGVRLSPAVTFGAGFGLFDQTDRAYSVKPDTGFHYGAWLDLAPGGPGPLGFKARLAAGGAVQGNTIERGRGLDNVELTPGRADLNTFSTRGTVQYGIGLGKLALIPNAGITWQRSTLDAFSEAEGDFPARFKQTRWQTSYATVGADLSLAVAKDTRVTLGGKADLDLASDQVRMAGTSTIPGMEEFSAPSLYTRKDTRGRFELGLEHMNGTAGFNAKVGVHTPVIGSKPTLVVGVGFGMGI